MKNKNKINLFLKAGIVIAVLIGFTLPGAAVTTNITQIIDAHNNIKPLKGGEWMEQASSFDTASRGIRFLDAVNEDIAWAIAYDGSGGNAAITDITKTTNGGDTWEPDYVLVSDSYGLGNICGLDGNIAYVALFNQNGAQDQTCGVYKTSDGGSSWDQLTSNPVSFSNNVWFWNENEGVALGDTLDGYFEVYTTIDGGITWVRVPQANYAGLPVQSGEGGWTGVVDVIGDTIIFGTNKGNAYISNDRGFHWTASYTGASTGGLNAGVNELAFKDAQQGLAAHDNGVSYDLFETSNGGTTWSPVDYTGNAYSSGLAYVPGTNNMYISTGAATGASGASYSLDGGHTWIDYSEMFDIQMLAVDFTDGNIGWAGGFNTDEITGGMFKYVPSGIPEPAFTIDIEGGTGITVTINNVGDGNATNLDYTIEITDGFWIKEREFTGTEPTLASGDSVSVSAAVKGIGLGIIKTIPTITVTITCDEGVTAEKSVTAKIIFSKVTLQ